MSVRPSRTTAHGPSGEEHSLINGHGSNLHHFQAQSQILVSDISPELGLGEGPGDGTRPGPEDGPV